MHALCFRTPTAPCSRSSSNCRYAGPNLGPNPGLQAVIVSQAHTLQVDPVESEAAVCSNK